MRGFGPAIFKSFVTNGQLLKRTDEELKAAQKKNIARPIERKRKEFRELIIAKFNEFVVGTDLEGERIGPDGPLKDNFFTRYLDNKKVRLLGIEDYRNIQKISDIAGQKLDIYIAALKSDEIKFQQDTGTESETEMEWDRIDNWVVE